ncbi:MAG: hypothetical protein LBT75_02880 [Bacilli bacterium]|jgi:hypothetical protein|nr:hypothetical protein [Bacilli bacterium]
MAFNDKIIIDIATSFIYQLEQLKNKDSLIAQAFKEKYFYLDIIEIINTYTNSNLACLSIKDKKSDDVAIIFQGSNNLNDWRYDNLNNLLNKPVNQYLDALLYVQNLQKKYRITYAAGNSLGGGCAQYVGLYQSNIRCLAINASPLTNLVYQEASNIINIRINSDPLSRLVLIDQKRYQYGYLGHLLIIKRSNYGFYDFYNHLALSHRGAIIENDYKLNNSSQYIKLHTKKALSLAEYLSYDLCSNNLFRTYYFNYQNILYNYNKMLENYDEYVFEYCLTNIKDNIKTDMIELNKSFNPQFKEFLKKDLLDIELKDELTYKGIYLIIDLFTKLIYQTCLPPLNKRIKGLDYYEDLEIIKSNIICWEDNLGKIKEMLNIIHQKLKKYNRLSWQLNYQDIAYLKVDLNNLKSFHHNYQSLLYDNIDEALLEAISNNKNFITYFSKFIKNLLLAYKLQINIPFFNNKQINKNDIDYLLNHYRIQDIIEKTIYIFHKDIDELLLSNSLIYLYDSNITLIKEYLIQIKESLINLDYHLAITPFHINKISLQKMLRHTNKEISKLIK